jgi:thioredoxin-like negative regulator of GroEL
MLDAAAVTLAGKVKILKVNLERFQEIGQSYGIRSMPTAILFDQGKIREKKIGQEPVTHLLQQLEQSHEGAPASPSPMPH